MSRSLRRVPDPLRADLLFLLDDAHTLALPLAGAAACGAAAAGAALLRRGDLDAAGRAFGDMRAQLKQVRRHASGASAPDEIRDIEMRLQREAAPVAISWARWQAQHAAERGKVRDMNLWLRRLAQYERTAGGRPSTNFTQTTRQHGLARGVQVALRGVLRLGAAGEVDAMDRALRTAHRWADANGQQLPDMSAYLRRGYARGAVDAVERGLDRAEPSNARCFSLLSRVAPFQEAELLWQAGAQVDVSMGGAGRLARKARPWLQVEAWGPYAFPMALVFETHAGLEQALGRIRLEPTSVAREVAVVRAQIDDLTKHFPTAAQPRFEEMSARVAQRLGFLAMDKLGYLDRFFGCARTGPLDFAISIWERLPAKAQNLGIDMPLTDLRG
ncbi:MAG TPA: hypothetical protein VFH51_13945, partial [Myxococcota bacterium]|nr:hypothetical protein [Myxococcota bacterium]